MLASKLVFEYRPRQAFKSMCALARLSAKDWMVLSEFLNRDLWHRKESQRLRMSFNLKRYLGEDPLKADPAKKTLHICDCIPSARSVSMLTPCSGRTFREVWARSALAPSLHYMRGNFLQRLEQTPRAHTVYPTVPRGSIGVPFFVVHM